MSEDKKKKDQDPKRNPFTLKGFMSVLQGKATGTEKPDGKDKK